MSDVVPMLTYADGPAAMDWLVAAFGFEEQTRWLDDQGQVSPRRAARGRRARHGRLHARGLRRTDRPSRALLTRPTPGCARRTSWTERWCTSTTSTPTTPARSPRVHRPSRRSRTAVPAGCTAPRTSKVTAGCSCSARSSVRQVCRGRAPRAPRGTRRTARVPRALTRRPRSRGCGRGPPPAPDLPSAYAGRRAPCGRRDGRPPGDDRTRTSWVTNCPQPCLVMPTRSPRSVMLTPRSGTMLSTRKWDCRRPFQSSPAKSSRT